jgi:hypothetical protein
MLVTLGCVALFGPARGVVAGPETADDVIARYIEAIGGRAKLDAVKTIRMAGKAAGMGGMELPMTLEFKRPQMLRIEFSMQGMTGVQAFDGTVGWFLLPFAGRTEPERMPSDMIDIIADQADFDGPLVDYAKKGHQVELVGKDDLEGSEVFKLKVTKKNGNVEYHFLDAEHFIPLQLEGKRSFQGTEMPYTIKFGDYKEVGGLLLAHSVTQGGMGGDMKFEKIEINVDLPDERFKMPEVKTDKPASPEEAAPADKGAKEATPPEKDDG